MAEKIKLSGVPETMLQTVYARAKESTGRGVIQDKKAVEIIDELDYDFSLADKDTAMRSGVIVRTLVLDRLVGAWLAKNSGAVVVNIACGLDTRCYRMRGFSHWYNLDLPQTMAVREKLLPESGTISQIAMSAMDDWGSKIAEQDAPALVIIEGLTMYLSEADVCSDFQAIPESRRAGRNHEPGCCKTIQGKIHRGQPCEIHMGHKGRQGARSTLAGFPICRRTRSDRRHGGVYAGL